MPDPVTPFALAIAGKAGEKLIDKALDAAWERFRQRRKREAQIALLKRVSKGETWRVSEDETLAMMARYYRAAAEGVARENLDLLAQAIASGYHEPTLVAARFQQWSRLLSELSREEILILGRYIEGAGPPPYKPDELGSVADRGFNCAVRDLVGPERPFGSAEEIVAHLFALQRTGLVLLGHTWGSRFPAPTALLEQLRLFIDVEDAIRAAADGEEN